MMRYVLQGRLLSCTLHQHTIVKLATTFTIVVICKLQTYVGLPHMKALCCCTPMPGWVASNPSPIRCRRRLHWKRMAILTENGALAEQDRNCMQRHTLNVGRRFIINVPKYFIISLEKNMIKRFIDMKNQIKCHLKSSCLFPKSPLPSFPLQSCFKIPSVQYR